MGGLFGVASKTDCIMDLFYGVDYHSHLGTRRGGMATHGADGFCRSIHNIENSPFRTKFERDVEELTGNLGIGCISDYEPQPLLIQSHLGSFAITTVGKINNADELLNKIYENGHSHFQEMSGGQINATELVAAPAFALKEEMYEILGNTDKSIDFCLNCGYYEHAKVTAPYLAPYQVVNSSLALLAMDVIDPKQEISQDLRIRAIKETKWQGRMETVLPGVIVDGAHNADGIAQFVKTVQSVQERYRIVLLFSAVVEKNYEEMIHTICSQTTPSAVVVTDIKGDRIVPAGELSEVFAKYTDAQIVTEPDIEKAFERACTLRQDGLLFCAGSLYLVGEIKEILEKCKA